jgi:hypothetical protein
MIKGEDYDYIIKIIQYLEEKHKISFFINSGDFDTLYGWWIKQIPTYVIYESIDKLVLRWGKRRKPIDGFKRFSYEVRKNFNNLMELKVADTGNNCKNKIEDADDIFNNFIELLPDKIQPLKNILSELYNEKLSSKKQEILNNIYNKLLDLHNNDPEIEMKTKKFLMNLNPKIRTRDMEKKYQINYIISKYKFPDVLLFFPDSDDIG